MSPRRPRRTRWVCAVLAMLSASVTATEPAANTGTETEPPELVGNWRCEGGPCLDEEIQLALEDGERIYNSWLHARPSASGGTWSLEGDVLKITCCGGLEMSQTVVAVDASTLELRDAGAPPEAESALYSRIE